LDHYRIGYDEISSRITIPIVYQDGRLVGIKGRAWKKNRNRYLALGDKPGRRQYGFPTYEKSLVVYGLDQFGPQKTYVFDEGELNVISLQICGFPALSCGNATMSSVQQRIIIDFADELILLRDDDTAGRNSIWGYDRKDGTHVPGIIEKMRDRVDIKIAKMMEGMDANDYLRAGMKKELTEVIDSAIPWYLAESSKGVLDSI